MQTTNILLTLYAYITDVINNDKTNSIGNARPSRVPPLKFSKSHTAAQHQGANVINFGIGVTQPSSNKFH